MIQIEDLCVKYPEKVVFEHLNLEIENGLYLLSGANGSGKSTLISLIHNQFKNQPKSQHLSYKKFTCIGDVMTYMSELEICYDITEMNFILFILKINRIELPTEYKPLYDQKKLMFYSQGEIKLVIIRLLLLINPEIILLDEPFENLDDVNNEIIFREINSRSNEKITIVSTHNNEYKKKFNNILLIKDKKLLISKNALS